MMNNLSHWKLNFSFSKIKNYRIAPKYYQPNQNRNENFALLKSCLRLTTSVLFNAEKKYGSNLFEFFQFFFLFFAFGCVLYLILCFFFQCFIS